MTWVSPADSERTSGLSPSAANTAAAYPGCPSAQPMPKGSTSVATSQVTTISAMCSASQVCQPSAEIVPNQIVLQQTDVGTIGHMGLSVDVAPPPSAPTPDALSDNLCWLLSRASHALTTELTAAMEDLDVSPRAQHVLSTAMTGDYTQTELVKLVGLDKTTMVVTLDELEAKGLAERRPSSTDRRAHVITVTKAGRRKVRQGEEIAARVRADVLSVLPDEEREIFLASLTKLVCNRLG